MSTAAAAGLAGVRPARSGRTRRWAPVLAVLAVVAALAAYVVVQLERPAPGREPTEFPRSADLAAATGVQFSRVAVVGDGGLVLVEYVVDDVEKATAFQADRAHVPTLTDERDHRVVDRVSIMKPGHLIRAGQTYYFVYDNAGGALRPGDEVTLRYLDHRLSGVPVQ